MQKYRINTPHIVSEVFADEEAAVINLKSGNYYSLNKTATLIWSLIEKGRSSIEIKSFIADNFYPLDTSKITEVEEFVEKLLAENLIVLEPFTADRAQNDTLKVSNDLKEYESPVIECYADMQELLLLDPIHEVEETNWLVKEKKSI